MSGFLSFGSVNISQVNVPPGGFGPNVNTNLTSLSGSAFTERQFLKALEIRRNLPKRAPLRQLTDLEKAEARVTRAESGIRSLPSLLYGKETIANMAHDELREAMESLNSIHSAQAKRNAIDEAKARIRAAMDAKKKH